MVDKTQIIKDRESGMTCQQVAEKHGTTKQYVSQITCRCRRSGHKTVTADQCIYPNLRNWMNDHKISRPELLDRMYLARASGNINKLRCILRGETMPKKDWIDGLLEATGMSYERLFAEKAWGGKNGK